MTGGSEAPATFDGITLTTAGNTRAERVAAARTVRRLIPKGPDRIEVLRTLFADGRPQLRSHGQKLPPLIYAARQEWLGRCRTWIEAETGRVLTSSQIPDADQRRYEAATGDVWALIEEGLR